MSAQTGPGAAHRRPHGSGDAWVTAPDGTKYWGTFGAAGLLVHDQRGVLLQHRVEWSHFGGTWGLPGGARHEGESAVDGALREASEEAGVPAGAVEVEFTSVLDLSVWNYTTVVARATTPFEAVIGDAESVELGWIPFDEVDSLPLHPGFAVRWPTLRTLIEHPVVVVVDAANVVGSRPTGWWKDRAGATTTFLSSVSDLSAKGVSGSVLGLEVARCWPRFVVVVEGLAREADDPVAVPDSVEIPDAIPTPSVTVDRAPRDGDDRIVEIVRDDARADSRVIVVTADAELRDRVHEAGAATHGPRWLWNLLEE